jgi:hypothetical protein
MLEPAPIIPLLKTDSSQLQSLKIKGIFIEWRHGGPCLSDGFECVHSYHEIDFFYLLEFVVCATSLPLFPFSVPLIFHFHFYTGVYAVKENRITK